MLYVTQFTIIIIKFESSIGLQCNWSTSNDDPVIILRWNQIGKRNYEVKIVISDGGRSPCAVADPSEWLYWTVANNRSLIRLIQLGIWNLIKFDSKSDSWHVEYFEKIDDFDGRLL